MGLDSLMAIELRNHIKSELELDVPVVKFLDGPTIIGLASELAPGMAQFAVSDRQSGINEGTSRMHFKGGIKLPADLTPEVASQLLTRVDELTEEEVNALLQAVSSRSGSRTPRTDLDETPSGEE
jgi:myxalamid-type polyketide synthase MxaB